MIPGRTAVQGLPWRITRAHSFHQRLIGLLGRAELTAFEGLWLEPCASVHTFGMRFVIDVIYLNAAMDILRIVPSLPPRRLSRCRGAKIVVELAAGQAARAGLAPGQRWPVPSGWNQSTPGGDRVSANHRGK